MPRLALALLALLLAALPARAQTAPPDPYGERWYELLRDGQKVGYMQVTWSPSHWQGRRTVRDVTRVERLEVRNMSGVRTRFRSTTTLELERGIDGTLWWLRSDVQEGDRLTRTELTWVGGAYARSITVGDAAPREDLFPLPQPVAADAEAFLSARARAGRLEEGDALRYLTLDERDGKTHEVAVEVAGREPIDVPGEGQVDCLKAVAHDPVRGTRMTLWIDRAGAFTQIREDDGTLQRRTDREQAEAMPSRPAVLPVTTHAQPVMERVFSADRLRVELHLAGDPARDEPELPVSPWSRPLSVRGDDARGWVIEVELTAHDDLSANVPLAAIDRAEFAEDLAPTPLMESDHPELIAAARATVAGAPDARTAAYRLARFVHDALGKESPAAASATALEILRDRVGDCSEHCVLFVALCRAAGIPARRTSGYVNVGSMWGGHAWAEIWVGAWIGADPTTGEIGSAARYVFFGYPDRAGSHPRRIAALVRGRLSLITTELEEDGRTYDLRDPAELFVQDRAAGRYEHVPAGVELTGVPPTWQVRLGRGQVHVTAGTLQATIRAWADQGDGLERLGGGDARFAGQRAVAWGYGDRITYWVHSRRRLIQIEVEGGSDEERAALERALAPTVAPSLVKRD